MEEKQNKQAAEPLGEGIAALDRRALCRLVARLCEQIQAEVGTQGCRGGVCPENVLRRVDGAYAGKRAPRRTCIRSACCCITRSAARGCPSPAAARSEAASAG